MSRDEAYLLDILIAARKALTFTQGVTREHFERDEILQNAVIRLLEIIGEAARSLSDDTKSAYPDIPWRSMVGMRNRLIHHYFRVDLPTVWDTVQNNLPELISLIEPLVPPNEPESNC
jgi:uncharacterized protein with HEPN domain